MATAIEDANRAQPAMVGFKQCGCCAAVDLDAHIGTKMEWKRKGYEIRMMPKADAIGLLKSSLCMHGQQRTPVPLLVKKEK